MASIAFGSLLRLLRRTSDPADSPGEADLWYRSDLDQVHAHDGVGPINIGPTGNLPFIRSTGWHSLPGYGAAGTVTPLGNRAYALPMWPGRTCTLTAAAVEVTLLGVGNLRVGVYNDTGAGLPGTLVQDFGAQATGILGVKTFTASPSVTLRPILYWLVVAQTGLVSVALRSRATWDPIVSETTALINANRNAYYTDTGFTGAFPASFGTVAGAIESPCAVVQLT